MYIASDVNVVTSILGRWVVPLRRGAIHVGYWPLQLRGHSIGD